MVDQMVYNATDFIVEHPGGDDILVRYHLIEFLATAAKTEHRNLRMSLILITPSV